MILSPSRQPCGCPSEDLRGRGPAKARTHLVDDVDAVVQLLPLQEGVQVLQQVYQVLLSVPVGNEDGHPLQGLTSLGMTPASGHSGVFCLYFLQSEVWFKNELALASCKQHGALSQEGPRRGALGFTRLVRMKGWHFLCLGEQLCLHDPFLKEAHRLHSHHTAH